MHNSMVKLGGHPKNVRFMQISSNIDGFRLIHRAFIPRATL